MKTAWPTPPTGLGRMRWSRRGGWRSCATAATARSACWRWRSLGLIKVALATFAAPTGRVVLIAAHALSRAVLAYPLLAFSPGMPTGSGARPASRPTTTSGSPPPHRRAGLPAAARARCVGLVALLLVTVAVAATRGDCAAPIGGYTGDTLGAVQQKAEIVCCSSRRRNEPVCARSIQQDFAVQPRRNGAGEVGETAVTTRWWWVRHAPVAP